MPCALLSCSRAGNGRELTQSRSPWWSKHSRARAPSDRLGTMASPLSPSASSNGRAAPSATVGCPGVISCIARICATGSRVAANTGAGLVRSSSLREFFALNVERLDDLPGDGCLVCGASLEHKRIDAVYCSRRCFGAHVRQLDRQARLEARTGRKCGMCAGPIPVERNASAKFCSRMCNAKAAWQADNARRKAERLERELKRRKAQIGRTCEQCGTAIPVEKRDATRFCASHCSNRWHYLSRKKAVESI